MHEIEDIRPYVEMAAVAVGALSGSLHAQHRGFDLAGVVVIGLIGGLGGGLIRDILLGLGPVLALRSSAYLVTAIVAAPCGVLFGTLVSRLARPMWAVDTLALGLFTVAGLQRAQAAGLDLVPSLLLGVITGVGGGVVRDVVCRETPILLLPGTPYSPASVLAGVVYLSALRGLGLPPTKAEVLAVAACFGLRTVAEWRDWRVPMPPDLARRLRAARSSRRDGSARPPRERDAPGERDKPTNGPPKSR